MGSSFACIVPAGLLTVRVAVAAAMCLSLLVVFPSCQELSAEGTPAADMTAQGETTTPDAMTESDDLEGQETAVAPFTVSDDPEDQDTAISVGSIAFEGTRIAYLAIKHSYCGLATVWLDGVLVGAVDLYASSIEVPPSRVWTSPILAQGQHTLEIRYSGNHNPASNGYQINIDSVDVIGTLTY